METLLISAVPFKSVVPFKDQRRFWHHVFTPVYLGECWLWKGGVDADGYGRFWLGGKNVKAHRFAYALLVGPVPGGCQLHHDCFCPACVNPAHLRAVTPKEHNAITRSRLGCRKTHCKHGHALTPENVYTKPRRGERVCLPCRRQRNRAYRMAQAAGRAGQQARQEAK